VYRIDQIRIFLQFRSNLLIHREKFNLIPTNGMLHPTNERFKGTDG